MVALLLALGCSGTDEELNVLLLTVDTLREYREAPLILPHLRIEPDDETLEELRQLGYAE